MARRYKRFEEHSERWQKQARKEGVDPKRWNSWLKLSDNTRKATDPRKYGSGHTVSAQRIERKRALVERKMNDARLGIGRKAVVRHNVGRMLEKDLDWTLSASGQSIRKRASLKHVTGYDSNPWWYR